MKSTKLSNLLGWLAFLIVVLGLAWYLKTLGVEIRLPDAHIWR